MDAFVVRKRRSAQTPLFEADVFLLVPAVVSTTASSSSSSDNNKDDRPLSELLVANGGRVLAPADVDTDSSAQVIVVLQQQVEELSPDDTEMLARILRRKDAKAALVVRAQWVRDSAAQQMRLATHSYDQMRAVLAVTKVDSASVAQSLTDAPDSNKRRRVELPGTVATDASAAAAAELDVLPQPNLTPWRDVNMGSLLILDARSKEQQRATPRDATACIKIAGFDMDGTWIETKSGKRFPVDMHDWKWLHPTLVRTKLEALVRDGYELVLFSNQNGIAKGNVSAKEIQSKVEAIITKLNLPVLAILATKSDGMRKPRLGGWHEMLKILGATPEHVDMSASFYCGDAAGRPKVQGRSKDFAATDYKFAMNLGVAFHTPEALFLRSTQRVHTHSDMWDIGFDPRAIASRPLSAGFLTPATAELAKTTQEIVVLVGPPAAGKSFFAKTHFGTYAVVNQDELKTVANCKKKCLEALAQAKSVVIDSTNRDARARSEWIAIATKQNVAIRCFEMDVPKALSMHLNTFRSLTEEKKIPDIAIHSFYKSFVAPQATEGFAEIVKVRFQLAAEQHVSDAHRKLLCFFL